MYEHRVTKFIFTVCPTTSEDVECDIPYVVWPMQDETRDRLGTLGKLAREEQVKIVTNEFMMYDSNDLDQPLFVDLSISNHSEPVVEMSLEKLVSSEPQASFQLPEELQLDTVMNAVGSPNHIKNPVAIVLVNCTTDLIVFDEDDIRIESLDEVVRIALGIFAQTSDQDSAHNEFSEWTGIKHCYIHRQKPPQG